MYKGVSIGDRHSDDSAEDQDVSSYALKRTVGESAVERINRGASQSLRGVGYGLSIYRHRLKGRHPLQLLASPNDPVPGSLENGISILSGTLSWGGEEAEVVSDIFWSTLEEKSAGYIAYANGFRWLSDLAATPDELVAQSFAEDAIKRWLQRYGAWDVLTWSPATTGARLINWITYAPLTLASSDMIYRSAVLNSMAQQARHLSRTLKDAAPGVDSIKAAAGLAIAGLVLPGAEQLQNRGLKKLERLISTYVLQDGGLSSRVPSDAVQVMRYLVILKMAYRDLEEDAPPWVQVTLDRMAPFVRGMRHGDGIIARFNGTSDLSAAGVDAILAASEARGRAQEHAPDSGFQRLKKRRTTIIMDAGAPTVGDISKGASAGTLSFELSDGKDPIVINMGTANPVGEFAEMARLGRSTAAHSTLILSDTNSTRINPDDRLGAGITAVEVSRKETTRYVEVAARHDGYAKKFDALHERLINLSADGRSVTGEDRLVPLGDKANGLDATVRFHLHPRVKVAFSQGGKSILLRLSSGHGWQFRADGGQIELVDSLFMTAPDRPQRSKQIVVTLNDGGALDTRSLLWSVERIDEHI